MSSRKRQSDTTVVTTGDRDMLSVVKPTPKSRLKIRVKRFHGVARWTWNAGSDDEVCGICQSAFEGVAPGCKYPGDECPVVFGKCGHAFHLQVRRQKTLAARMGNSGGVDCGLTDYLFSFVYFDSALLLG